jgi:hypothetical protein
MKTSEAPEDLSDFGACCACGKEPSEWSIDLPTAWARNIIVLDFKSPTPGHGWGCVQCSLSNDGAVACICDECLTIGRPIRFAVDGDVRLKKRVPIETLSVPHQHDMTKHPGEGGE